MTIKFVQNYSLTAPLSIICHRNIMGTRHKPTEY